MKRIKISLKINCLAAILFVVILPACKTISQIHFQSLEAPALILPSDISRIAFVDRNLHFPSDSVEQYYTVANISLKDSLDQTGEMPINCYYGFVDNLSEFWIQDSIPFVRLPINMMPNIKRQFSPLSWDLVSHICQLNQVDILLVLENIRAFTKSEIIEEDVFWLFNKIDYQGIWRIYDPLHKKIYDERVVMDSLFMEASDSNLNILIKHKTPSRREMMNEAAYVLGRYYAKLILPKWVDISRDYFVSGDKRLSTALYFINKDDFDTAINMWKSLTKESDMKLAGRAAYNLAVVHEMKGDFKNARDWIRKSNYFYKKMKNRSDEYKKIEAYTLILNARWSNEKKVKQFFGEQ